MTKDQVKAKVLEIALSLGRRGEDPAYIAEHVYEVLLDRFPVELHYLQMLFDDDAKRVIERMLPIDYDDD